MVLSVLSPIILFVLLQGPFISFKGFLEIVKDFRIAQLPSKRNKLGIKFYNSWDLDGKLYRECAHQLVDAPLTMRELAIIFIECSKTFTPALVLSKYLKSHYEGVFNRTGSDQMGHGGSTNAPGSGVTRRASALPIVGTFMGEPWDDILAWMDEYNDWNVINGINFVQFIDCLAKCGILAYSSANFDNVLQTAEEKILHFFTAHMKIMGFGVGGSTWKVKVDARLHAMKNRIKDIEATAKKPEKDTLPKPKTKANRKSEN